MRLPCGAPVALASLVAGVLSFPVAFLAGEASARAYQEEFGAGAMAPTGWWAPLLSFADPARVYQTYGRLWMVAFAVFLLAALCLRARAGDRAGAWGRRGLALMAGGLAAALAGVAGDYGLGRAVLGQVPWGASFAVTMLGLLAYMAGAVVWGVVALRARLLPRVVAASFLAAPLGFAVNALLVPNAPAAFVPPLALGWMALGAMRLREAFTPRLARPARARP